MIFASVGSMLPFERLVRAVDDWARDNPHVEVFVQIGDTPYEPRHVAFARMISMSEYRERLRACDLFVAHVGMGSVLQALEEQKQALLLPRRFDLGEHTTDHQIHTARKLGQLKGLCIADTKQTLQRYMTVLLAKPLKTGAALSNEASPGLISGVRAFLESVRPSSL